MGTTLEHPWAQGGRKVISDGGSLVIRKMVFFQRISHFKFFHYIKSKKMGAPRDTRGPQFRPPCRMVFDIENIDI